MKKLILTLMVALSGMLSANAQEDMMTITMKDGSDVTLPVTSLQGMDYTTHAEGVSNLIGHSFTVSCVPVYDPVTIGNDSIPFFTFTMSEEQQQAFKGITNMVMRNPITGESRSMTTQLPGWNDGKVYEVITKDGYLFPYRGGVGNSFNMFVQELSDYEPVAHILEVELTAQYGVDNISFTKKATCQFTYTPNANLVEEAYYLVGSFNDWKLDTPLLHNGDNRYDGMPFQATIRAPKSGNERLDVVLRVVPASAIAGNNYDAARALGVIDSTYYMHVDDSRTPAETYYSWQMAADASLPDAKLPASDGADIYNVQFSPSWNFLNVRSAHSSSYFSDCYACLGFASPDKNPSSTDIPTADVASSVMIRQLLMLNELTTDEMACVWTDPGIPDMNYNQWTAKTPQLYAMYMRLQKGVEYCNRYLAYGDTSDPQQVAEVRFLRAYYNAQLLDLFGNVPLYTAITDYNPATVSRQELFNYIEGELKDCVADMAAPRVRSGYDTDYGRVDQAAAWMLLARLYLNAEVYTGTPRWSEAASYAQKVIDSPYALYTEDKNGWSAYQQLFMGDNGENGAAREAIMTVAYDGETAQDWGHQILSAATAGFDMTATDGSSLSNAQTWAGIIARPNLVWKFFSNNDAPHARTTAMIQQAGDDRALLWGQDRNLDASTLTNFHEGFSMVKFINCYADPGKMGKNYSFPDYDVFLMRYAEALLTLGEASLRTGDSTLAATCLNQLRQRAHAAPKDSYTLQEVLDEWTREFYLEGRHRTDLIRFGQYGGNTGYQWRWKGGTYSGVNFELYRNWFPIPEQVIKDNPHAKQNPGY